MSAIEVHFIDGRKGFLPISEPVYTDRSCGQYEAGWLVFTPGHDDEDFFVSEAGLVYRAGTDKMIGTAPVIKRQCDKLEAEMQEGMDN